MSRLQVFSACTVALFTLAAGACDSAKNPTPDAAPADAAPSDAAPPDSADASAATVTLTIDPAALSVAIGSEGTIEVTIVRGGGFAGPVTIAGTGAPTGVTVTGSTIAAAATSGEVAIAVGASATAGAATISVTGTAAGVTIAPASLALTVTAASAAPKGLEGEAAYDYFGTSVALSANGSRLVVGAPGNDATGSGAGHARVFERSGATWAQVGVDLDGEAADDRFGTSVAITADGNRVAVGSYLNDGGGNSAGNVRVFDYMAGAWTQVGADIDGTAGDGAGFSVALSSTGHRIIVGGPGRGSVSGDARIYELTAGAWTQVGATITQSHEFANAVSMSGDGNRIAVGQPGAAGNSRPGTTYVYDWNGTTWAAVGAPIAGEAAGDVAGSALSLSTDGSIIAIGAPSNTGVGLAGGGGAGGQVRVYRFAAGAWSQLGADLDGAPGSAFGTSVSISGDGTRLLAGGPSGSLARYYTLAGDAWMVVATPVIGNEARNGTGVAISADGHTAATGATYFRGAAGAATGQVRLYDLP